MAFVRGFSIIALGISLSHARFGEAPLSLTLEHDELSTAGGEDISVFSSGLRAGVPLSTENGNIIALTASYNRLFYDWDTNAPFDQLSEGRIGLFTLSGLKDDWRFMSITSLSYNAEEGISPDKALTLSGIYGTWYSGWENLILGGGIGVSTKLDDKTSFFPLILLDWEFYNQWHITTRPTPGTRFGPGASFLYDSDSNWNLYFGARYVSQEYELRDSSTYEYKTVRLFSTLQYGLSERLYLSATLGYNLSGEIELDGTTTDLEASLFTGLDLSWDF